MGILRILQGNPHYCTTPWFGNWREAEVESLERVGSGMGAEVNKWAARCQCAEVLLFSPESTLATSRICPRVILTTSSLRSHPPRTQSAVQVALSESSQTGIRISAGAVAHFPVQSVLFLTSLRSRRSGSSGIFGHSSSQPLPLHPQIRLYSPGTRCHMGVQRVGRP